jgi:hypothetical protein
LWPKLPKLPLNPGEATNQQLECRKHPPNTAKHGHYSARLTAHPLVPERYSATSTSHRPTNPGKKCPLAHCANHEVLRTSIYRIDRPFRTGLVFSHAKNRHYYCDIATLPRLPGSSFPPRTITSHSANQPNARLSRREILGKVSDTLRCRSPYHTHTMPLISTACLPT